MLTCFLLIASYSDRLMPFDFGLFEKGGLIGVRISSDISLLLSLLDMFDRLLLLLS